MDNMGSINFAELMPLIAKLGENPAALSALSGLMSSMGGAQSKKEPPPPPKSPDGMAGDPFSAIMGLMNGASGGINGSERSRQDMGMERIFGSREEIKNRILLLSAVRPYLSEERRHRLEAVIKLLRLAELGSLGSLLG